MLSGGMADAEIAEVITRLRERGETADEIFQCVQKISQLAIPIKSDKRLLDVCGTGGSGLDRFNVSTASAIVLSANGIPVLKHGNRGTHRPNGSFDLLEALGIRIEQEPALVQSTLDQLNLGFVYARHFHPQMKNVASARALAGGRSIFNLAAPLSNPALITYQVLGSADREKSKILAQVCKKLRRKRFAVVYGDPGIDELSISGQSLIYEWDGTAMKDYLVTPEQFGIQKTPYESIPGGDADENIILFRDLLDGRVEETILDMVAINAGLGMYVARASNSLLKGYQMAKQTILSGRMKNQFQSYKKLVGEPD